MSKPIALRYGTANLNPALSAARVEILLRKIAREGSLDRIAFQEISTHSHRRTLARVLPDLGYSVRFGMFGLAEAWDEETLRPYWPAGAQEAPFAHSFLTHYGRKRVSPNRGYEVTQLVIRATGTRWPNLNTHGISGVRPAVRKATHQEWRMQKAASHWNAIDGRLKAMREANRRRRTPRLLTFTADMNNNLREDDRPWRPRTTVRPHLSGWNAHSIDLAALVKTSPATAADGILIDLPGNDHACVGLVVRLDQDARDA